MKNFEFVVLGDLGSTAIKRACADAAPEGWTPRARIEVRARLASLDAKLAAEMPALLSIAIRAILKPANVTIWVEAAPMNGGQRLVVEVERKSAQRGPGDHQAHLPLEPPAGAADREVENLFGPTPWVGG